MADAREVVLYDGASVVADGSGDPVDIGALHTLLRGSFDVTALDGSVFLVLDTSTSEAGGWRRVYSKRVADVDKVEFTVDSLDRFVRVGWEFESATSLEFSSTAESHVLYATRKDLRLKELSADVMNSEDSEAVAEDLLSASGDADDALNAQYSLPISTWPDSLRARCASIAKYKFFNRSGFAPQGVDELLVKNYDDALAWLRSVATRKIILSGVTESVIEPIQVSSGNANDPDPVPKFSSDWGDF